MFIAVHRGTGMNLKASGGHQSGVSLVMPLHYFGSKIQLVVLDSTFVMVSIVWSVSRLLFYSQCPLCPIESAPLAEHNAVPDTCEFSYCNSCVFAQLVFWPTEACWGRETTAATVQRSRRISDPRQRKPPRRLLSLRSAGICVVLFLSVKSFR